MMEPATVVLLLTAILSSAALNTWLTRRFRKGNDVAEEHKTHAEASQILAKAAETTLSIMQTTIQSQDERIRAQDIRIQRLEDQVLKLHTELLEYKKIHGPLNTGDEVTISGVIV
jgi:hypothetical protein